MEGMVCIVGGVRAAQARTHGDDYIRTGHNDNFYGRFPAPQGMTNI